MRFDYQPEPWMDRGACIGYDPEWWYADTFLVEEKKNRRTAITICRECPVQTQCLAYAMEVESGFTRWGIWGGTTPDARRQLAKGAVA